MNPARILTIALLGLSMSCATATQMIPGTPGATGTVDATTADNGNTALKIRVQHLAPAAKMQGDATTYVVWVHPPNATPQNVGALEVDKNYDGALDTVTPFPQFRLTVTPEPSAKVSQPSHDPVFTAQVSKR